MERALKGILEIVTDETLESARPMRRIDGIVVGWVVSVNEVGDIRVDYPGNGVGSPILAQSTVSIQKEIIGREAALLFEQGDPARPILIGLIWKPKEKSVTTTDSKVSIDGERIVLTAQKEIVLQCGEASITLTRAGKVLIRGTYLLSRSSGVNRIKGGVVLVN